MKHRFNPTLILVIIVLLFNSCHKSKGEEQLSVSLVNQEKILYQSCSLKNNSDEIIDSVNKSLDLYSFCQLFSIDEYKLVDSLYYAVVNSENGYMLIWFDSEKKAYNYNHIEFSNSSNYKSIKQISIGQSLNDVEYADPTGKYDFKLHSWSGYPKISHHFFRNGSCYFISYSEDWKIIDILSFTI